MPTILIVEDNISFGTDLKTYLSNYGFEIEIITTGDSAIETIVRMNPTVVLLDLMLPGTNGLEICRQVRNRFSGIIIMLTASQLVSDHIQSLDYGADDFINKPFEPSILLARIRRLLSRNNHFTISKSIKQYLSVNGLVLNLVEKTVCFQDSFIVLTDVEFKILQELAQFQNIVLSREDLYRKILDKEYDGIDRGLDVHVSRIRRKLQSSGFESKRLKSIRGLGYMLVS